MPTRREIFGAAASLAGALPFASIGLASSADRKPLKYLQIGVGHAHANKITVYRDSGDWEVVGIVEEDDVLWEKAQHRKEYQDLPRLSLRDGLATEGLSVVGVETEVKDLLKYAEIAVEAGFHVHLDKPAGESFSDYRRLMQKADSANLVVQMGFMFRFNPAVLLLREVLAEGWLGDVFETHAVMSKALSPGERDTIRAYPGGIMFELGCHVIDLTHIVLGRPDKVTPYARRTLSGDGLQDNMLAVLDYPQATATVRSSGLEVEGFGRRLFTAVGTRGTFHIQPLDRPTVTLTLDRERTSKAGATYQKGTQTIPFDPPYRRYVGDAADLAATIRGEKANDYPSAHDLAVQETVILASGLAL